MMSLLKVYFPQWQGSGDLMSLYDGAEQIRAALADVQDIISIDVSTKPELRTENGIIGYEPILAQLKQAVQLIDDVDPERILTIGGDCSVVLAPAAYLNQRYQGDMALLWIDAHADLNTPDTSPSQRFYGMPLRCLLGEGDEAVLGHCQSTLQPDQVVLLGLSDQDPAETDYIKSKGIKVLTAEAYDPNVNALESLVRSLKKKYLYIHIDFDVFMIEKFAKNGVVQQLAAALETLCDDMVFVGLTVAGYSEQVPLAVDVLKPIMEIGVDLMGGEMERDSA